MYNFLFILLITKIINISSKPLILNFKTRKMTRDNFMKTLINNDIYTSILVGEDKQSIEMNIKSQQSSTIILSETCLQGESAKKFVETQSSTYKILLESQTYYMYEFKEAVHSQDNIILFEDNNKQIEVNDYKFMLAKSLWYDSQPYMAGVFGLKLQGKNEEMSLPEGTGSLRKRSSQTLPGHRAQKNSSLLRWQRWNSRQAHPLEQWSMLCPVQLPRWEKPPARLRRQARGG